MSSFKINIADPKASKGYKTEVKDQHAAPLLGLNIGEKIEGNKLGIYGYEFEITGGSDYCGFPMRKGILGERKRISILKGIGFKGGLKGMKKKKTVCGHKINDKISAVNLKVLKEGSKKLAELFGSKEDKADKKPKEAKKEEPKPKPKKETNADKKEEKSDVKVADKKEEKSDVKVADKKETKQEPKQESKEDK